MATIKRKLPYELYDVAGLEDWFSQMAAEGFHLEDCWQDKARFTVGAPKENIRFRLEAQQTYQYDWNKDREYAEQGWHHVTTIIGFYYIFRCDDPTIEELHTDPTIQSWTMKKLIRRQWFMLIYVPLMWFIMQWEDALQLFGWPMEVARSLLLQNELILIYGVTLVAVVYFMAIQGVMLVMFSRLKKRLASGLPMDRTKRYPRSFWMHGFLWVLSVLMWATFILCLVNLRRERPEVDPADYPYVSLEEVIPGQYAASDELSFWTGAELESSLLVPVQFKYGDAGLLREDQTRVRTYLYYYETISPAVADIILKGSIQALRQDLEDHRAWWEKNPTLFDELVLETGPIAAQHDKLDVLYYYDYQYRNSEYRRTFFGCMGSKAFALYTMLPDPEAALELMIAKMEGSA